LAYGIFSSTSLILVNYWKELAKYIDKRRYLLLIIVIGFQAGLFLVLKFYFFEKFTSTVFVNTDTKNGTNTNSTAVNKTLTNSTLLF